MVLGLSNKDQPFFPCNIETTEKHLNHSPLDPMIDGLEEIHCDTIEDIKNLNTTLQDHKQKIEGSDENLSIQEEIQPQKKQEIQQLVLDILKTYSNNLENKMYETMKEVESLQKNMESLQKLLGKINDLTDEKTGQLKIEDEELKNLLDKAKELGLDFQYEEGKPLSKFERENLIEKIKNMTKDMNTQFSLLSKKADRLNSERTELMKYAYMIMKTLHDIFMKLARMMKGSGN